MRPSALRAVLVALLLLGTACTAESAPPPAEPTAPVALRLGTYDFAENQILGEVYAEAVRRAGIPVTVQHGIGTREIVAPALEQGVLDVVIDYLGTALSFARPGTARRDRTPADMRAELDRTLAPRGLAVLDPAHAADQNGFAVAVDFAAEERLTQLSDLVPLAPQLVFGGPPECVDRPFCLPGLREVYGLEFAEVLPMPSRGATVEALLSGQIDVGMIETTDARLGVTAILLLDDDRGLQPHENIVPLVRIDALERYGAQLRRTLDQVSARLATDIVIDLNRAVEIEGLTPAEAAARWWDDQ